MQVVIDIDEKDYKEITNTSYIRDGKQYSNVVQAISNGIPLEQDKKDTYYYFSSHVNEDGIWEAFKIIPSTEKPTNMGGF